MARRQSSKALFPAARGWVPHAEPLALPAVFLREVARADLAFELPKCGASPLAVVVSEGRCRIGNVEGRLFAPSRLFPRADKSNAAKDRNLLILRSGLSAKGAGNVWGSEGRCRGAIPLLTSKTVYSLPTIRSRAGCPLTSVVQTVVEFKNKDRPGQPRRSSGRLRHSEAVAAFGESRLREAALPCMGPRA